MSHEKKLGIAYVILAAFFFSLMSLFIRLSGDIPPFEKSFFRNFVALFFALAIIKKNRIPMRIKSKKEWKYLILRSVAGTVGIFGNFYATDHLVIADANMLNKLSPFFAIIFSYFLIKEKVAPYQAVCVIAAFIGALCIIKPGGESLSSFPALVGLAGGLGAGFAYTCVRILSQEGVPGPLIVFFFSTFSCLASVPFSIALYVQPTPRQLVFLLLTGAAACGGQFCITAAYSHAPAKEISVYDYSQILFAALYGILFFGEFPDAFSVAGYIIIIGAGVTMFIIGNRPVKEQV